MKRNPSMTEEDWRWFQLSVAAKELSAAQVASLEKQLRSDPSNMDLRVSLLGYFRQYNRNDLKHENAREKLFELILWFIENTPAVTGCVAHYIQMSGHIFKGKAFARLRQAWLDQVAAARSDGTFIGNAASFIAWNDFETAAELFERA